MKYICLCVGISSEFPIAQVFKGSKNKFTSGLVWRQAISHSSTAAAICTPHPALEEGQIRIVPPISIGWY
jgi:hypothetical protein